MLTLACRQSLQAILFLFWGWRWLLLPLTFPTMPILVIVSAGLIPGFRSREFKIPGCWLMGLLIPSHPRAPPALRELIVSIKRRGEKDENGVMASATTADRGKARTLLFTECIGKKGDYGIYITVSGAETERKVEQGEILIHPIGHLVASLLSFPSFFAGQPGYFVGISRANLVNVLQNWIA